MLKTTKMFLRSGFLSGLAKDCQDSNPPFHSSSSFQRKLESRRGGCGDEWLAGFTGWRASGHPPGCHSRYAGMACFNHWIPACAGMTVWLRERMLKTTKMSLLSWSSFQRKLESRRGGCSDEWLAGFTGWRASDHPPGCHSRCAGMACFNHWIPACAGMTAWLRERMLKTTKMFLLSWSSFQRKLESRRGGCGDE